MTDPSSLRALVVVARFNEGVTRKLLEGAKSELVTAGFGEDLTDVVWVPGAFELPIVIRNAVESGRYALAVALGAVIRGETPHFDYVAGAASHGLMDVATTFGIPIGFGLLTCDSMTQALARAGGDAGNKGEEAARAAVETWRALAGLSGSAEV